MDMTETIAPRSDQLNAEDFLTGPATVTVASVSRGSTEQPVNVVTEEFGPGRPFKPCKSMRRVMVAAWGPDASTYTGKRMTLYRDPNVRFGPDTPGGIRISHMSGLDKPLTLALTVKRGKREAYSVQPLPAAAAPKTAAAAPDPVAEAVAAFAGIGVTVEQMEERAGVPRAQWGADEMQALFAWYTEIQQQDHGPDPELWQEAGE